MFVPVSVFRSYQVLATQGTGASYQTLLLGGLREMI